MDDVSGLHPRAYGISGDPLSAVSGMLGHTERARTVWFQTVSRKRRAYGIGRGQKEAAGLP